jgi:hypothetical protein
MTFLVAVLAYPALLGVLALGAGLLAGRLAGWTLGGALLVPLGLATLIVVAQLTTLEPAIAPLTPAALVVCAAAGYLVAGPRRLLALARALRADPWPALAGVAVYTLVCAPILLAGRATQAAYLLDTTAGIQMLGADFLISHGLDFGSLASSSYKLHLQSYFGASYPSGAHTLLGASGRLAGTELVWLYGPFLATMLAFSVPSLHVLARRAGMSRALAAVAAAIAATPALVYAYAQMGAIKEITLLALLPCLLALLAEHRAWLARSARAYLPVVLVGGAGLATIGLAFAPWLLLAGAIGLAIASVAVRERRLAPRTLAIQAAAIVAIAALPTILDLGASAAIAKSLSQGNALAVADPGNLLQPLHVLQSLGVWLHGDHRLDPPTLANETYALIGISLAAIVLGIMSLVRGRRWMLLVLLAGTALIWWRLTLRGTIWTDAKLLVIVSPLIVLLAFAGAGALLSMRRRVEGVLLAAALCTGVLWSAALIYHDTNLAPTDRFAELSKIDARFAGQGPALLPDFDEYALYLGRRLDVSEPGLAYKPAGLSRQVDRVPTGYGQSYDLDALPLRSVRGYRLLVVRRSPEQSRPPSGYRRVLAGRFYEVWRREPAIATVLAHVGGGSPPSATGSPRCSLVRRAAALATSAGGVLRYVRRAPDTVVDPRKGKVSPNFSISAEGVGMRSIGEINVRTRVPRGGRYTAWLRGDFSRATQLAVDGRRIGEVAYESGGNGNYATSLPVTLAAGTHRFTVSRGGGTWHPGDNAPSRLVRIVLEPQGEARTVDAAPAEWRSICARDDVDWVEAIRKPG